MCRLVSRRGSARQALLRHFSCLSPCLPDTPLDGCHAEWIFSPNGCHVPKGRHLVTWGLDTALISDLSRCAMERWCLGGVIRPRRSRQACRASLGTCLRCDLALAGLACLAREVSLSEILLPWFVLVFLIRSLIPQRAISSVWPCLGCCSFALGPVYSPGNNTPGVCCTDKSPRAWPKRCRASSW